MVDELTPYLRKVLCGEQPTANEWQAHLVEFYRVIDDNAESSMYLFANDASSYDRLARAASAFGPREILDAGCGDGRLAEALERANPAASITGLDISEAELSRLRAQFPRILAVHGDLCSMPFADAAFDLVASHLVLMHVSDIDVALGESRRVLRRGGVLAFAIVGKGNASSNAWWPYETATGTIRTFYPAFSPATFQDPRLVDEATTTALLRRHGFEGDIAFEHYCVSARLTIEQLKTMVDRSYHVALLPPAIREAVAEALTKEGRERMAADEAVSFALDMRIVTTRVF